MKAYSDFPPLKYFMRVLKGFPRSALLYTQLWQKKGKNDRVIIQKNEIRKEYLLSPTLFRNLIAPLAYLNLILFIESDEKYQIEMAGSKAND